MVMARTIPDETVREIRERYAAVPRASQRELAKEFGVSQAYISWIVNGHVRADAGGPLRTNNRSK
jgi:predicted transcriptional regulator